MDEKERTERCLKVINEERCKHNMVYEYCAHCQAVKVPRYYKFPLEFMDDDGELRTVWLHGEAMDTHYIKYRKQNPDIKQSRKLINKSRGKSAHYVLKSYNPRH
jgi:hypothetical protein